MRIFSAIYNQITQCFKRFGTSGGRLPPEKLSKASLAEVQRLAETLRGRHGVDVQILAEGEIVTHPKAVDPAVEEAFAAVSHKE